MRARLFGATAVLAAAATLLSSCRSNVNVAATVNGERISESTVSKYIDKAGPDQAAVAQVQQQQVQVPEAKPFVLELLVREKLLEHTLATHGGVPSSGQLAAQRAASAATVQSVFLIARAAGTTQAFKTVVERFVELEVVVGTRLRVTSSGQFLAAVQAGANVRVNPRFGVWNPNQLALKFSRSAGLPDYLKLQPVPRAAAQVGLPTS